MIGEKHVETLNLQNGLKLEIWDQSRIIAGDRWLVRMEARAAVPLREEYFHFVPEKDRAYFILRRVLGTEVTYNHVQEKHFVDANQKEEVFNRFVDIFKKNTLPYLQHPDFSRRFCLSRYRELKARDPRLFLDPHPYEKVLPE